MNLEKRRLGYLEGILSVILNTVLFLFKLWVGLAAGSVAMIADAWHTLSDTLTSLVVILGFWISSKPGDREHPFGHGRAELVASVIIGTLLGVVGANFFKDSLSQLQHHQSAVFGTASIVVFSISVAFKEALAQFSIWAGRKTNSQALKADGWHHRSDALASALIIVGALLQKRFWWIDGALGIGVSILILYAAYGIIREASNSLMGEQPDAETTSRILALVKEEAPVATDVHHIHMHRYGDHIEATLHARMPQTMSIAEAHRIASLLETRIRDELGIEPTIHLEPRKD